MMYLEISGRQAGKTTRLLRALHNKLLEGQPCVLIAPRTMMLYDLCVRDGVDLRKNKLLITASSVDQAIEKLLGRYLISDVHWFVDEFDMLSEDDSFYISDKGYYATSPKRLRSLEEMMDPHNPDALVQLIRWNKGKYERFVSKRLVNDQNYRDMLSLNQFLSEGCGSVFATQEPTYV